MFDEREKIALFIDGANLYATAKSLGFDIDYKRLLQEFQSKGYLLRAYYYTALADDQEYSSIRPLIDWLDYNGYTVVTKPTKEFVDASGRRKIKGNMDIELAVHVMEMVDSIDHLVLFSGDGDFRSLVEAIQRKGVRVTVVSTISTQPPMVADELRAEIAVAREQHDVIDRGRDLHRVDRKLDVHVALDLAAAGLVDELLGRLGDDRVAVVVEPIDQGTDRGILLILDHGGIIERTQQVSARLKLAQQPLVVDVETERLGGGVEVGAVDEQRDLFGRYGHLALSINQYYPRGGDAHAGSRRSSFRGNIRRHPTVPPA